MEKNSCRLRSIFESCAICLEVFKEQTEVIVLAKCRLLFCFLTFRQKPEVTTWTSFDEGPGMSLDDEVLEWHEEQVQRGSRGQHRERGNGDSADTL